MEKINVAELLKDCSKGMELDCTTWENVTFEEVRNNTIIIRRNNKEPYYNKAYLNQYGCCTNYSDEKCRIFPKGKTTWEGFVPPVDFKDGDIVVCGESRLSEYVSIFKSNKTDNAFYYHAMYPLYSQRKTFKADDWALNINIRLATEEEKQKLFQAIKDNGYNWNEKTKTLEKLQVTNKELQDLLNKYPHDAIVSIEYCNIRELKYIENKNLIVIE